MWFKQLKRLIETGMSDDVLMEIHKVEAEEAEKLMEAKRKGEL
jgi:hypothetical protein